MRTWEQSGRISAKVKEHSRLTFLNYKECQEQSLYQILKVKAI